MTREFSRRDFLISGATALAATQLSMRHVWAAADAKPRDLRHVLSNETYSLRAEIGKITLANVAEFHKKELNIKGVSLNDIYFKSWEKDYLDGLTENFK